jgi:L-cystine uptake protein TcyP (sodium:dicarboxylate symporter family)
MPVWVVYIIIILVIIAAVVGFKIFKKRMQKRVDTQKTLVDQHKVTTTIFVIDKKKGKIGDSNLPKSVIDQIPRLYKIRKVPLITAKVGPQIVTLLSEENVYDSLPVKKNVRVDIAGIFIVSINEKRR